MEEIAAKAEILLQEAWRQDAAALDEFLNLFDGCFLTEAPEAACPELNISPILKFAPPPEKYAPEKLRTECRGLQNSLVIQRPAALQKPLRNVAHIQNVQKQPFVFPQDVLDGRATLKYALPSPRTNLRANFTERVPDQRSDAPGGRDAYREDTQMSFAPDALEFTLYDEVEPEIIRIQSAFRARLARRVAALCLDRIKQLQRILHGRTLRRHFLAVYEEKLAQQRAKEGRRESVVFDAAREALEMQVAYNAFAEKYFGEMAQRVGPVFPVDLSSAPGFDSRVGEVLVTERARREGTVQKSWASEIRAKACASRAAQYNLVVVCDSLGVPEVCASQSWAVGCVIVLAYSVKNLEYARRLLGVPGEKLRPVQVRERPGFSLFQALRCDGDAQKALRLAARTAPRLPFEVLVFQRGGEPPAVLARDAEEFARAWGFGLVQNDAAGELRLNLELLTDGEAQRLVSKDQTVEPGQDDVVRLETAPFCDYRLWDQAPRNAYELCVLAQNAIRVSAPKTPLGNGQGRFGAETEIQVQITADEELIRGPDLVPMLPVKDIDLGGAVQAKAFISRKDGYYYRVLSKSALSYSTETQITKQKQYKKLAGQDDQGRQSSLLATQLPEARAPSAPESKMVQSRVFTTTQTVRETFRTRYGSMSFFLAGNVLSVYGYVTDLTEYDADSKPFRTHGIVFPALPDDEKEMKAASGPIINGLVSRGMQGMFCVHFALRETAEPIWVETQVPRCLLTQLALRASLPQQADSTNPPEQCVSAVFRHTGVYRIKAQLPALLQKHFSFDLKTHTGWSVEILSPEIRIGYCGAGKSYVPVQEQLRRIKLFLQAFLTAVHKADPECPTSVLRQESVWETERVSGVHGFLKTLGQ